MKAITIWQPWASLIMAGVKPFEFRTWAAPAWIVGQRIVIHAAKRPVRLADLEEIAEALLGQQAGTGLRPDALPHIQRWLRSPGDLPLAAGLGTAVLGRPRRAAGWDNWGWPLADIQPFEQIVPRRGAQGFWIW